MKESNEGLGVPIEVEIRELKYLQDTDQLNFVSNSFIIGKVERFETMFRDLESTFLAVTNLLKDPKHDSMSDRVQRIYGNFRTRIGNIKNCFYKAVGKIDLNAGANIAPFDNAFTAYLNGDKGFVPGKYARQLMRLQIDEPLPEPWVSQ